MAAGSTLARGLGLLGLGIGLVLLTRVAQKGGHNGRPAFESGSTTIREATAKSDSSGPRQVVKSVTVNRPAAELYAFWRKLENLPQFMHHLESVETWGNGRSHWVARAPLGATVEWDAEIVEDVPSERISWRSTEGSQIHNAGAVRFEPAADGHGTRVTAEFSYDPPGGTLGVAIARLTGEEPAQQASDDLRRFKQIIETGEVVQSEATGGNRKLRQRPAQPVEATPGA